MKIQTTIGVDLHKCQLNTAVLDEGGRLVERRVMDTKCRKQIGEYFGSYGDRAQVAVESVGFYQWFWDLVRPRVGALHLADPAGVRAHAGRKAKTDRNDALLLATLLRDQRLPMAYVPREPVRQLREMVRHRHSVARALAGERRSLRWLALKNNLPGPTSFTSERAQKWLLSVEPKLSAVHRVAARQRLDHIIALERDVWDIEQEIDKMAEADPLPGSIRVWASVVLPAVVAVRSASTPASAGAGLVPGKRPRRSVAMNMLWDSKQKSFMCFRIVR
jgi:transposase